MGRTTVLQEVRIMRLEDVYGRFQDCQLSCEDAADLLGVSVSTFFRYRGRYEADGAAGLYDRRERIPDTPIPSSASMSGSPFVMLALSAV